MDVSSLLQSVVGSPQPGMDLAKGVPEKNLAAKNSKASSFDESLASAETQTSKTPQTNSNEVEKKVKSIDQEAQKSIASNAAAKPQSQDEQIAEKPIAQETEVSATEHSGKAPAEASGLPAQEIEIVEEQAVAILESIQQLIQQMNPADLKELPIEIPEQVSEMLQSEPDGGELAPLPALVNRLESLQGNIEKVVQQLADAPVKNYNLNELQQLSQQLKNLQAKLENLELPLQKSDQQQIVHALQEIKQNPVVQKFVAQLDQKTSVQAMPKPVSNSTDSDMQALARDFKADQSNRLKISEVSEKEPKFDNQVAAELGSKPTRVKDLADHLFIQKGLQSESTSNLQFNKLLNNNSIAEMNKPQATIVRQNLFEDMKGIISQAQVTKQGGSLNLQLRPGNLGHIKIDVQVEGESVRIAMQAEKSAAHSVLKSQAGELRQQLQIAGLRVDDIQVNSARSNQGSEQQQRDPHSDHGRQNQMGQQDRQSQNNSSQQDQPQRHFELEDELWKMNVA